ncbi:putative Dol-P-Glc:Glc(2)Man(9)GlcNAc(2)-PP-Dol alpha-1,2-glucosyltransferase [Nephila pilipes]|uniref:Dol-P-Glc:Glc(2)Man(9)GlcNAc(2)-PP-Dol alpha-1,2-glucosyltransferase n=1 Tax=Nephila pilipes TaxID=299642 RepID=A0A8X6Q449_NEPPI|nr:putative Dol-P-Glc:Glc(2)Man(9)GlcNAc(2)-PP-Dol alpha-1,2-glucosyltransferase [Nephila pilipes]
MDEIFHFPQAVKYYKGIYKEWDPKITTPPGLYIFTVGILNPVSKITNLDVDKLTCFRLVNLCFTTGTIYVVYRILQHHHKEVESKVLLLSSFNITIFPVLYFFNFLYYTDCGSTFFVLLMYYWHLKKIYLTASFPGAVALLFRQTNIVWIFYIAAEETLQTLFKFSNEGISKKDKNLNLFSISGFRVFIPLWKKNWKQILKKIFVINIGYIPIAIGSVAFVLYNGSIALGDKTAHEGSNVGTEINSDSYR